MGENKYAYSLPIQLTNPYHEKTPLGKKDKLSPRQQQILDSILKNFEWMKSTSTKNRPVDLPSSLNFYRDYESLNIPAKFLISGGFGMGFGLYVGSVTHILSYGPTTRISAQQSIRKQFGEGFFRLPPRINQEVFWRSVYGRVGLAFCLGDALATSFRDKVDVWNAVFGCVTGGAAFGLIRHGLPKGASSASTFFALTALPLLSANYFFDIYREEGWFSRMAATINSSMRAHYEANEKLKEIKQKQFDRELERVTKVQEMRALRQEWEIEEWSHKLVYWNQQAAAGDHSDHHTDHHHH